MVFSWIGFNLRWMSCRHGLVFSGGSRGCIPGQGRPRYGYVRNSSSSFPWTFVHKLPCPPPERSPVLRAHACWGCVHFCFVFFRWPFVALQKLWGWHVRARSVLFCGWISTGLDLACPFLSVLVICRAGEMVGFPGGAFGRRHGWPGLPMRRCCGWIGGGVGEAVQDSGWIFFDA